MISRRDFVKTSSASLAALTLHPSLAAQSNQVKFLFRGLIAFAVARPKADVGSIPSSAPHVTALLVRETEHPNRRLVVPGAWVNSKTDVTHDITDCSVEVNTGSTTAVSLVTNKRKTPHDPCAVPGEWADVSWIANLERVTGQAEVEQSALTTLNGVVTARMKMQGGTFRSGAPTTTGSVDYSKQVWEMKPPPASPYAQAFTDSVFWETGQPKCTIVIRDAAGTAKPPINVSATSDSQILVTNLPSAASRNPNPLASEHFVHYYDLLTSGVTPKAIPTKLAVCPASTTLANAELAARARGMNMLTALPMFRFLRTSARSTAASASASAAGDPLYCENALLFEAL